MSSEVTNSTVALTDPEVAVYSMQNWLEIGPTLARVDSVELSECALPECSGFEIRYLLLLIAMFLP
jgi:hypothetical protein